MYVSESTVLKCYFSASQMQQGRRTSSLKASYEALSRTPDLSKDFSFGSDGYRGSSGASSQPATPPEPKAPRNKK